MTKQGIKIPYMTSMARLCRDNTYLSTGSQSLAPCSGPQAGQGSHNQWLPVCRLTGCAVHVKWSPLHKCQWPDSAPQSLWQRGTGAAGQGGALVSGYLDLSPWAHDSTHHWLPVQKQLATFSHCQLSCYHAT